MAIEGGGASPALRGSRKKKQDDKEHREDEEGRDEVNIFDAQVRMSPRGKQGTGRSANIDQSVVNGITDRADVWFGSAGRGANDTGLYQRDAERGKDENASHKQFERHGVSHGREPSGADGANQEIGGGEDKIGERKSAPKAQPVGSRTAEDGEEPYHAAKKSGQGSGLLGGKIQFLLQIESKGGKGTIVRKTLKDLADIGDPEGRLEAGADLLQTFGKCQKWLPDSTISTPILRFSPSDRRDGKTILWSHR